jgi:hypothetical protein
MTGNVVSGFLNHDTLEKRSMPADTGTTSPSKKALWTGRILSGLAVLFLVWDGTIKVIVLDVVAESFIRLGYPVNVSVAIGVLELVCVALYIVPRTSLFGAVLLTGFLGGAIATHLRVGDPLFTHVLFPTYVGLLIWAGLALRDVRVRAVARLGSAEPLAIGSR